MEKDIEEIAELLKRQAEIFLLDSQEFYPFGTCIDKHDKIVPIGAYLKNVHPSTLEIFDLLEKAFIKGIIKGDYKIAGIAINVSINEEDVIYDAIEMRFFKINKEVFKKYVKYRLKESAVEFF